MAAVDDARTRYGALRGEAVGAQPPILPFSISVEGLEGTGKSRFGLLTCPTPVVHINFSDRDATAFLYDMSEERRKQTTLYSFAPAGTEGWTVAEARQALFALSDIAKAELGGGQMAGGTFILDSGSSWWDAVQQAEVAPLEEQRKAEGGRRAGGLIYQQANLIVSGVVSWIKNQGIFFILTHQKRQRWDKDGPVPGVFDPRINSKVPYLVEVRLDLRKECIVCGGLDCQGKGHIGRKHIGRIIKFGRNTALEGIEFEDTQIAFPTIYKLYANAAFPKEEALL